MRLRIRGSREFGHYEPPELDFTGVADTENSGNSPLYKAGSATHIPPPMTLAVIDWLSISINLLLVIFVIVCFLMTLIILMQRPKQEGLGAAFGGGVTDQVFGARTTNVLQRGTVYLGSLFFILSLALAVLIGQKNKTISTVTKTEPAAKVEEAPAAKPVEALAPKSLSEELPAETPAPAETAPAPEPTPAPAAPAETAPPVVPAPEAPADK
jgi:preprotein translocase subunit SecG